jgi:hypothetical protein
VSDADFLRSRIEGHMGRLAALEAAAARREWQALCFDRAKRLLEIRRLATEVSRLADAVDTAYGHEGKARAANELGEARSALAALQRGEPVPASRLAQAEAARIAFILGRVGPPKTSAT